MARILTASAWLLETDHSLPKYSGQASAA